MSIVQRARGVAVLAAVAGVAAGVAGCNGGTSATPSESSATSSSLAATEDDSAAGRADTSRTNPSSTPSREAADGTISPRDLPAAPTLAGGRGAMTDLSEQNCRTKAGRQKATATVTASEGPPSDYLITLSWTTPSGDVLARGDQRIEGLPSGESRAIAITADVPRGATQCVWGVQRAAA